VPCWRGKKEGIIGPAARAPAIHSVENYRKKKVQVLWAMAGVEIEREIGDEAEIWHSKRGMH